MRHTSSSSSSSGIVESALCNNISLLLLLLLLKLPLLSQDICTLNADHLDGLFDLFALVPDGALSKGHPQEVECARAGIGVVGPHDQRELDAGRIGLLEQRVDGLGGAWHDVALERGVSVTARTTTGAGRRFPSGPRRWLPPCSPCRCPRPRERLRLRLRERLRRGLWLRLRLRLRLRRELRLREREREREREWDRERLWLRGRRVPGRAVPMRRSSYGRGPRMARRLSATRMLT